MRSKALSLLLTTVVVSKGSDSSHNTRVRSVPHRNMSTTMNEQANNDGDDSTKFTNIRVTKRTKRRFELQGTYNQTAEEVMRSVLDRLESCHCRPLRRVTT
jgi:hypothetical protein